jgi:23S rRNA (guanine2445-N2)-methyltransferase / 23S rRNA (guanine2069-N7)-methyltransferase
VSELLGEELRALAIDVHREHAAGVAFSGTLSDGYRACLESRTASRILLTIAEGDAQASEQFYEFVRSIAWEEHVAANGSIAIDIAGEAPSWVRRTTFAAQRAKDAVVDRLTDLAGQRPSVDLGNPDVRIGVWFARTRASVSIDLSGAPLHRRGYRQSAVEAPVKENLAAALLMRCGWSEVAAQGGAFCDPMCGSGTFVIESALMAGNHAPGLFRRRFGFERWLGHDRDTWETLRAQAVSRSTLNALERGRFAGSDVSLEAVRAALANVNRAGLGEVVAVERRAIEHLAPTVFASGLVFVNPPYGVRIGEVGELAPLYRTLGATLLRCYPGWQAAVFTGNPPLGRELGLRARRVHTFYNGPIECRLLRFELDASAVEPSRDERRAERRAEARARPGAQMFANRLHKNLKSLGAWARAEDIACFRVYDADMPEYAFAIDIYANAERHVCVQEYEAPETVDAQAARARRDEAFSVLEDVLELPASNVHVRVRRRQRSGAQYEATGEGGRFHEVRETSNRFLVNFTDYLDTGLFLDHRLTRQMLAEKAHGRRFLNLFAYTGTATVCAVRGGALTSTTVDMSRTYLDWATRNLALNELAGPAHGFVQADCLQWLAEQPEQPAARYGLVFVDPPTRSRSKRMQREFDVQRDHVALLASVATLLEPGGEIVFSNNYRRFKLDREALSTFEIEDVTRRTIPRDFARDPRIHQCFVLRPGRADQRSS